MLNPVKLFQDMIRLTKGVDDKQTVDDYQLTFSPPHGKRVLANIQKWSGFDDRILPQGDCNAVAFELGKREMFLHILDKLVTDPYEEKQETAEGR